MGVANMLKEPKTCGCPKCGSTEISCILNTYEIRDTPANNFYIGIYNTTPTICEECSYSGELKNFLQEIYHGI